MNVMYFNFETLSPANCMNQEVEEKRKLSKKNSEEYLELLRQVFAIRVEITDVARTASSHQNVIENSYMLRILDKLHIEIDLFLKDCYLASKSNCRYCV